MIKCKINIGFKKIYRKKKFRTHMHLDVEDPETMF